MLYICYGAIHFSFLFSFTTFVKKTTLYNPKRDYFEKFKKQISKCSRPAPEGRSITEIEIRKIRSAIL